VSRGSAVPVGTTSRRAPHVVSAGLVSGFVLLLFATSVAIAAPAAAIDDPTRPDARVTHGPSCRPGGLVVEITAGTAPYFVRLATTRNPAGEDEATLAPGTTVVLRSDDVDWGETIDGRLEYAARDDSGATHVDELHTYSFTRPTQEDCEAVLVPGDPTAVPSPSATVVPPSATEQPSASPVATTGGQTSEPPVAGAESPAATSSAMRAVTDPPRVAAGGSVTLLAAGFLPGERITVLLHGTDTVLASATAGADGSVAVQVRIPERTAAGAARVDMVGHSSEASTDVELQVAALATAAPGDGLADLVPLVAAASVLVATVAGLVSVAGRQRAASRRLAIRSA
jgi:hypothetical protein